MKTLKLVESFLRDDSWRRTVNPYAASPSELKQAAREILQAVLEEELIVKTPILETSVHRSRRSKIWVASFTGPFGGQVWRSTGSADYAQAIMLAKRWESIARKQRARLGQSTRKPTIRVSRGDIANTGPFTQEETAKLLKISVRCVRENERRALNKLRNHPELKDFWSRYLSGELVEERCTLERADIQALFDLATTPEEVRLIEKIVRLVQTC